jgi:hypothetical protein
MDEATPRPGVDCGPAPAPAAGLLSAAALSVSLPSPADPHDSGGELKTGHLRALLVNASKLDKTQLVDVSCPFDGWWVGPEGLQSLPRPHRLNGLPPFPPTVSFRRQGGGPNSGVSAGINLIRCDG